LPVQIVSFVALGGANGGVVGKDDHDDEDSAVDVNLLIETAELAAVRLPAASLVAV